jgi:Serine/threonine protein kinase
MLCSVRYIHSKGIIHRDLKLENFLFSTNEATSELKMIDFGLSKHFKYGEVQHEAVGTPYTVAPEVIHGSYDERCDVWAIGVITYLLLSGDPPFGGCGGPESLMEVRSNILAGRFKFEPREIWESVSQDAKDFICKLLVTDPTKRPTAKICQQEQWLTEWANKDKKQGDNLLNREVVKALVNFKEYSDMRKLLCEVLSFTLLPDQITDLRKEFEKLDIDGSGEISLKGLKQVLMRGAGAGSLGALTEEEIEDIFNAMRVRKTETRIHWHEFIAAGLSQCKVDERNLRLAFDRLDADHKGFITFDNLMDMMGRDDAESEDELRAMWTSSMKACKCHDSSQITYEDFLLLMKGQTVQHKDLSPRPYIPLNPPLPKMPVSLLNAGGSLDVLHEMSDSNETEDDAEPDSGALAAKVVKPQFGFGSSRSYEDQPISMDDEDDNFDEKLSEAADKQVQMQMTGNFTPPQSPVRSPKDFVTPTTGERFNISPDLKLLGHSMPELPDSRDFSRRRSKSVDDQDYLSSPRQDVDQDHPTVVPDIRRAMLLPEHSSGKHLDTDVHDDKLTPLVVNRKLYRAHRQMRLAVLEASKRFEEEQLKRTKAELQQAQQPDGRHFGAGLVMKRGKKKEVSSDAIRRLMIERQSKQKTMVDIAARKGGRGKRVRKKTVSDMSAMLSALPTGQISVPTPVKEDHSSEDEAELTLHDITKPEPTVLGVFRKTKDPFQQMGKQVAHVLGKSYMTSSHSNMVEDSEKKSSIDSASQSDMSRSSSMKLSASDGELNAMAPDPQTP